MSSYYEELAASVEQAQRDGWRHRLEQWLRFEVVLRGLDVERGARIVDLGSGTGELYRYLSAWGPALYLGVEQRKEAVEEARAHHEGGRFLQADFSDLRVDEQGPFDYAVAIGTMVDGAVASDEGRRQALSLLVERLEDLGQKGWALVVLDEERLQKDLIRSLEPSLRGAWRGEIQSLTKGCGEGVVIDEEALPTDLFVLRKHGEDAGALVARISGDGAHLEVLRRYEEIGELEAADEAWFWMVSGRFERARAALGRVEGSDPRREILAVRLRLL